MNRITEIFRLCNYLGRNLNRLARTLTEILNVIAPESLPFSRICVGEENVALSLFVCVLLLLFFFSRFDAYNALCFIESKINSAWNLKTMIIKLRIFLGTRVFARTSSITLQPSILRARITTSRAELHRGKLDTVGFTVVSWQKQNFCRIVIERFHGEMEGPSTPHCWSDRFLFLGLCFLCSCGKCFRKPFLLMWTQSPNTKFIFKSSINCIIEDGVFGISFLCRCLNPPLFNGWLIPGRIIPWSHERVLYLYKRGI